jgi:hypothetical protein
MIVRGWFPPLAVAAVFLMTPAVGRADVILGQVDTFETGTTLNWFAGLGFGPPNPLPPVNVATGGPAGAGDNFLLLSSNGDLGFGPGSRLTAMNEAQWAGDYLAAGIQAISMDVNNLGATDLFLRLAFEDAMGGPPTNVAFSTMPLFVPAGSGWISLLFATTPGALTAGLGSIEAALANATVLRLYNSPAANFPNPGFPIPAVTASLGVDNIAAVPEPATLMLVGSGILVMIRRNRAHRR